ncbi:HesA/MoeB/ThiF family protein [Pseudoalteromonas spongiae]|uniref:HesA/MoeB/ThiF family protein n=1 Tax=Pseudoalteromonas spongiae TaxID=298657 RepID=A0ABU8EQH6_9GAMM
MSSLSNQELIRYSRQLLLPEIDENAQLKLKAARVLIIGLGGLGSPAAFYLAASGIGKLTLVDHDEVELSNLQRQILYKISHIGQSKSKAAGKTLQALNNQVSISTLSQKLNEHNAKALIEDCDLVLDCSDNFKTRYLVNRLAKQFAKPLVSGAAMGWQGQLCIVDNRDDDTPCYECLFPNDNKNHAQNCDTLGVISPLLGVIGSQQAIAAILLLLGETNLPQFLQFDAQSFKQSAFSFAMSQTCTVCNKR